MQDRPCRTNHAGQTMQDRPCAGQTKPYIGLTMQDRPCKTDYAGQALQGRPCKTGRQALCPLKVFGVGIVVHSSHTWAGGLDSFFTLLAQRFVEVMHPKINITHALKLNKTPLPALSFPLLCYTAGTTMLPCHHELQLVPVEGSPSCAQAT